MNFDPDDLTLNEIEEAEELLGAPIDELLSSGSPKGRALKVIVYLLMRRTDPSITLEQAGQVKLSEIDEGNGEAVAAT